MESGDVTLKPRVGRRLYGLFRLAHPFPGLLNVVALAIFSGLAARGLPPLGALARALLAMFCIQTAIGAFNDYMDRELDAATKKYKPIVRGLVTPAQALTLGSVAVLLAVILLISLGLLVLVIGVVWLAAGLAYDCWLKRTPFSGLAYAVALPLDPLWGWVAFGQVRPFLLWIFPLGFLLGLGLNLANTLPDLEGDVAHGERMRGLAHLLGRTRSLALCWGLFILVELAALTLTLTGALAADQRVFLPAFGVSLGLVIFSLCFYWARPRAATLQTNF